MHKIWLDDVRSAPEGWFRTKDIEVVKQMLREGNVEELSLDNDLGLRDPCSICYESNCPIVVDTYSNECSCGCHSPYAEGYKLVDWMEETNLWPTNRPTVHSSNIVAVTRMTRVIERHWK